MVEILVRQIQCGIFRVKCKRRQLIDGREIVGGRRQLKFGLKQRVMTGGGERALVTRGQERVFGARGQFLRTVGWIYVHGVFIGVDQL